jgi:hypothetical protein
MKGKRQGTDSSDQWVIGLSRYLRWGLGTGFLIFGIKTFPEGGWAAVLIGSVLVITGFLRPTRCLDENIPCNNPQEED